MSFNHLVSLPASITALTKMTRLLLSYNDLDTKNVMFETMLHLEELHLTSNRLTGIPHMFARLTKVRSVESVTSLRQVWVYEPLCGTLGAECRPR
jgi:Leucine-rich repeat (LRR) protein